MSISTFLIANKAKLIATALTTAAIGGTAVTLKTVSHGKSKTDIRPLPQTQVDAPEQAVEQRVDNPQPNGTPTVVPPVVDPVPQQPNPGTVTPPRQDNQEQQRAQESSDHFVEDNLFNATTQKKNTLSQKVSTSISEMRSFLGQVPVIKQLQDEVAKCEASTTNKIGANHYDFSDLTKKRDAVQKDMKDLEVIQTSLATGEVAQKEKSAQNRNKDPFKIFSDALAEAEKKVDEILKRDSKSIFLKSFTKVEGELIATSNECSWQQVIKMNNLLGEHNNRNS